MGIGHTWRPWYGHPRPATEETAPLTETTPAHDLPDATGALLYVARNSRDASRKSAARAELVRRGLNPKTGLKAPATQESA